MNHLSYPIHNYTAVEQSAIAFAKGYAMKSGIEGVLSLDKRRKQRWASAVISMKEI